LFYFCVYFFLLTLHVAIAHSVPHTLSKLPWRFSENYQKKLQIRIQNSKLKEWNTKKGNHKQNEKTIYGLGENIGKWYNQQWINFQNTNSTYNSITKNQTTQSKNWAENLNRHFFKENMHIANTHIERCSLLLIIREMYIKTTIRYHLSPVRLAII